MVEYIKFTPDVAKDWKSAQSLVLKDDDFKQYQARIRDACTASQLESKLWLVTELINLDINFTNALLLGGWYANFIVPLLVDNLSVKYILNLELDPDAKKLSYKFNKRYMPDTKVGDKFTENFYPSDNKSETSVYKCDIRDVMFKPIKPDVWGDFDLVINTSCEHMFPMSKFREENKYLNGSDDPIYVLQSTDEEMYDDHINCVHSPEELADQANMVDILYMGTTKLDNNMNRFMVIGR